MISSQYSRSRIRAAIVRARVPFATALLATAAACSQTPSAKVAIPPGLALEDQKRFVSAVDSASRAYETNDPDRAMMGYQRAVVTYPEFPAAWNNLGVLLLEQNRHLEAAEAFRTAAELAPADPRPLYNRGLVFDRRGWLREARDSYARSLERDPNFLPALRALIRADARLNTGSVDTLEWIKRALLLENDPEWIQWMRFQKLRVEQLADVMYQTSP